VEARTIPAEDSRGAVRLVLLALATAAYAWLVSNQAFWERLLGALFPDEPDLLFPGGTIAQLTAEHLAIVGVASAATIAVGIPLGIWVTRASGRDFRQVVGAAVDFGQVFPPVAVLALAMPILGFGLWPSVIALFLYGLFPVVSNTIAGIEGVPENVREAARGMGFDPTRILTRVELPLAAPVIMAGVRTSVVITIGTATVAAVVGAGGLGGPIIGGINVQNLAYVLQGSLAAALLAVLADAILAEAERRLTPRGLG